MAQDGSLRVDSQVAENFILHRENFATEPADLAARIDAAKPPLYVSPTAQHCFEGALRCGHERSAEGAPV
jgi:hypothetical protein